MALIWIGVQVSINLEEQTIVLDVPAKLIEEVLQLMQGWRGDGGN